MPSEREQRSRTIQRAHIMRSIVTNDSVLLRAALVGMGSKINAVEKTINQTPLCAAAWVGNVEACRILVEEANANLLETERGLDNNGAVALIIAAEIGHIEVVRYLAQQMLARDATALDRVRANRGNALYTAAKMGHLDVVRLLVQELGADVSAATQAGKTPIFVAAQEGHVNVLNLLIHEAKSCVNKRITRVGATPLYVACHGGHIDAVKLLLDVGHADVNLSTSRSGRTPLHAAASQGHLDVVAALLDAGADPCIRSSPSGQTPLISACNAGHEDVARLLVARGADINTPRDNGITALYVAANGGHSTLVTFLVQQGADTSASVDGDGGGETPLAVAVRKSRFGVVRSLLSTAPGLDVNEGIASGNTPLYIAALNGNQEMVRLLLNAPGIDVNRANYDGGVPLHAAAGVAGGGQEILGMLLAAGANSRVRRAVNPPLPLGQAMLLGQSYNLALLFTHGSYSLSDVVCASAFTRTPEISMLHRAAIRLCYTPWGRRASSFWLCPVRARRRAWMFLLSVRRAFPDISTDLRIHILSFLYVRHLLAHTKLQPEPEAATLPLMQLLQTSPPSPLDPERGPR